MSRLALGLLLLATGANADERIDNNVRVVHDDRRGVTCYLYSLYQGASISCIPDSQLQSGDQRQLFPHEQQPEPTPAIAPGSWIQERYQL
ncbi:hypothetical protein AL532_03230 [Pseudomonas monteilii]|uniref:hypothetical protein n=1 Tax=Pseudomonas TaxID=286 RepID=UPI000CEB719C|nr:MULTISPECIES: hypothetical protein [Pseudomonas]AVH35390.1 hypothetical protein AL532_03230 [Pseudomonas monteilii]MDT3716080.1 hypothetical protein [Pseudomonas soli]MDT3732836.1 hypothetical protein [Pseudomonas soli]